MPKVGRPEPTAAPAHTSTSRDTPSDDTFRRGCRPHTSTPEGLATGHRPGGNRLWRLRGIVSLFHALSRERCFAHLLALQVFWTVVDGRRMRRPYRSARGTGCLLSTFRVSTFSAADGGRGTFSHAAGTSCAGRVLARIARLRIRDRVGDVGPRNAIHLDRTRRRDRLPRGRAQHWRGRPIPRRRDGRRGARVVMGAAWPGDPRNIRSDSRSTSSSARCSAPVGPGSPQATPTLRRARSHQHPHAQLHRAGRRRLPGARSAPGTAPHVPPDPELPAAGICRY